CSRIEPRDSCVFVHSNDRAISFSEDSEPLLPVLTDHIAVSSGYAVMRELFRFRIKAGNGCSAASPNLSAFIDSDGMCACGFTVRIQVFVFRDLLRERIQMSNLAQRRFRKPDGTVGRRDRRMNTRGFLK